MPLRRGDLLVTLLVFLLFQQSYPKYRLCAVRIPDLPLLPDFRCGIQQVTRDFPFVE